MVYVVASMHTSWKDDISRNDLGPNVLCVGFIEKLAVDTHLLVVDPNYVTWNADHPFDKILSGIFRITEHDNVATFWFAEIRRSACPRRGY